MPVYPHKCQVCGLEVELIRQVALRDSLARCQQCGGVLERQIALFTPRIWKPLTLEHINVHGEGPLTFHSEAALRRYCKENKLKSGALL